ncbi:MAG: hypothetical protein Q9183_006992 [Haloplaca sp. 2 TL-2023]
MSLIQRKLGRAKALASNARREAKRAIDFLEFNLMNRSRLFDIDAESMVSVDVPRYSLRESIVSPDRPTDIPKQSQPPRPERIPSIPRQLRLMNPDPPTSVENEGIHQWLENLHNRSDLKVPRQGQKKRYVAYQPYRRVPLTGEGLILDMSFPSNVQQAPIAELPGTGIADLAIAELEAEPVRDIDHYPSSLADWKGNHAEIGNKDELFFNVGTDLRDDLTGQMPVAWPSAAELEAEPVRVDDHYPSGLANGEANQVRTGHQDELFFNVGTDLTDDLTEQMTVGWPSAEESRDERQVPTFQLHRLTVHAAEWRRLSDEFPRRLTTLEDAE